jgi:hypothetical protein
LASMGRELRVGVPIHPQQSSMHKQGLITMVVNEAY